MVPGFPGSLEYGAASWIVELGPWFDWSSSFPGFKGPCYPGFKSTHRPSRLEERGGFMDLASRRTMDQGRTLNLAMAGPWNLGGLGPKVPRRLGVKSSSSAVGLGVVVDLAARWSWRQGRTWERGNPVPARTRRDSRCGPLGLARASGRQATKAPWFPCAD